jgi:hypothetical protein
MLGRGPVDGQMNHVFGMCTGQNHTLPHPVSRKGKDSVAEDAVLSFDGNFQPSNQENDARKDNCGSWIRKGLC